MTGGTLDVAATLRTASEQHRAGQLDIAETLYRRVLALVPEEPNALHLLGVIAYQQGDARQAVALIGRALRLVPENADAWANLGNAQQALGEAAAAMESCRRAIALRPELALAHAGLARALNDLGAPEAALDAARRAAELDPTLPDAPVQMAVALSALERPEEAGTAYQQALRLNPDQPAVLARFGQVLSILGHNEAALTFHRRALDLRPDDAEQHLALARSLMHQLATSAAIPSLRRATELAPDCAEAWFQLGTCLSAAGDFSGAGDALRRAIALRPDNTEARRRLAAIDQLSGNPGEIDQLRAFLFKEDLPAKQRIAAGFAAGEALDRMDRFDEAFSCVAAANDLVHAQHLAAGQGFDADELHRQVDEMIEHCSPTFFVGAGAWGNASELPVLVVGMPRSGTSLVEQILASHPAVAGAGELLDLHLAARAMMLANPGRPLADWDPAVARHHGAAYLARLQGLGGGARRVVDKMPDNVIVLGIAAALFPRARVILCRRDPRDVCLSCYFQHFAAGHEFSNDLAACGRRALEIERLMRHWTAVLPVRKLVIQYEAVVADLEREARRLIDFLDLPWDPACLEFHQTARTVLTASSWQVRQPLYASAVGRWRCYAPHLGPLLAVLDAEGAGP